MQSGGVRSDGAQYLVLGGGLACILRGLHISPPVDESVVDQMGPWRPVPMDRRHLQKLADRARVLPLQRFRLDWDEAAHPRDDKGRFGEGSGGGRDTGEGGLKAPHRPLTTEEKGALHTYLDDQRTTLVGEHPTGQDATDLATLEQRASDYPKAQEGTKLADSHSFGSYVTKPGMTADDVIDAMEKGTRGVLTPEREALHDAIVRQYIKQSTEVSPPPQVLMLGGGPASGKSSGGKPLENAITVDPDAIRTLIPDYQDKANSSQPKSSAAFTHEEASALAKRIANEAGATHNLVIDGTGDNSVDSMLKKIGNLTKNGQEVVGRYATNDVNEAWSRSLARGTHPPYRVVPETTMRSTHAGVSRVLPQLMEKDVFKHVELWDTNDRPATKVMSKAQGQKAEIHDQAKWDAFLAKAK